MFQLSSVPVDENTLKASLAAPGVGAFASFAGLVRDQNAGRKVVALEYEAYGSLAEKEAEKILNEARLMFKVNEVKCVHRTGKLAVGETAVWVGVTAAHRDNAFKACRYVIDELKNRVPIWKKEYYSDGESGWIGVTNYAEQR